MSGCPLPYDPDLGARAGGAGRAGVAEVLRRQADDLRGCCRERALSIAAALPVKLPFSLVICFLPGLFAATLGSTFYQFFQFADSIIQNRRFK